MDLVQIDGRTSRELVESIERAVEQGRTAPGDIVPSVRALARHLAISPATVAAAYRDLRTRGVLTSAVGRDTRISTRPPLASRIAPSLPAGLRDLSDGNPDRCLLPSLADAAHTLVVGHYSYGDATLIPGMAELAAGVFAEFGPGEEQLCLTGGAMDGLERVLAAWLKPGDKVLVEDPCYTAVLDLVRSAGLITVPVAVDEYGLAPDRLRQALAARPAALIHTPRAHNPSGAALDADRAAQLAAVLDEHPEVAVFENDHAGPIAGQPFHTLTAARRRWAVVRTVSKFLGPDLRLAFLTGDRLTVSRIEGRQRLGTGWVSHILQHLVLQLSTDPAVRALTQKAERTYTERRERFLASLAAHGVLATGRSGLNVLVPVAEEFSTLRRLQELGWLLRAGEPHRLAGPAFVRITISTLQPAEGTELAAHLAETLHPGRRSYPA